MVVHINRYMIEQKHHVVIIILDKIFHYCNNHFNKNYDYHSASIINKKLIRVGLSNLSAFTAFS